MADFSSQTIHQQRRLLFFALAVVVPILLLTGLTMAGIRSDHISLEWVQAQRQRAMLDSIEERHGRVFDDFKFEVFSAIEPALSRPPGEAAAFLEAARKRFPALRGFFCVDAERRLIYPRPDRHYTLGNLDPTRVQTELSQKERRALIARLRIEDFIMTERMNPSPGGGPLERVVVFETIASDETLGGETWAILEFAKAEEAYSGGSTEGALAFFRNVAALDGSVSTSDGRELRAESWLKIAEFEDDAATRAAALCSLLNGLKEGRYRAAGKDRFLTYLNAGLEALRELEDDLSETQVAALERGARFAEDLAWRDALEGELRLDLKRLTPPAGLAPGEWARLKSGARVLCYRSYEGVDGGLIGFQLGERGLDQRDLEQAFESLDLSGGLSYALVPADGAPVLTAGGFEGGDDTISRGLEAQPLWRIEVSRDPGVARAEAQRKTLLSMGLVILALFGVGFGTYSAFRFIKQSFELSRLKADFMSNITHELKTPLTSIQMFADLLGLGRISDESKRKEYYNLISTESQRLRRMIDEILDFARSEQGRVPYVLAEGDVSEVVRDSMALFELSAEAAGFKIESELPKNGALPPADLDPDALARVMINLLSNAVKYSIDTPKVGVKVWRDGHDIRIDVSDEGVGIEPPNLDRIFDKFFRAGDPLTREVSGTGLGLSLVDSIVRAHAGRVLVESEKGAGSTFSVFLPIVEDYREEWPLRLDTELDEGSEEAEGEAIEAGLATASEEGTP